MANTKRDRFIRIAEARTNKAIQMIRLLGNCSNTSAYEYSPEEIRKIFAAIDKELKTARARFSNQHDDSFSLK